MEDLRFLCTDRETIVPFCSAKSQRGIAWFHRCAREGRSHPHHVIYAVNARIFPNTVS